MKLKIAIIGTRGIPNNYGGFEQFAEFLSIHLVTKGHDVYVYNCKNHPHKKKLYKGVKIIHKLDLEKSIGTIGQFFYDFLCILDTRKRNFDIILQLGYTSSSIWSFMLPKKSLVITNMDGLEWQRTKFKPIVQRFLMYAEKLAVNKSDYLISDSIGIKNYLKKKYQVDTTFIAYGTEIFENPEVTQIHKFNLLENSYNILIARIEPENNVENIIKGVILSKDKKVLLIVGDYSRNRFGKDLYERYKENKKIRFLGSIYNKELLNNLRYYSHLYFHGHTVGGTNPSLLEAMACSCLIIAHDNAFNKSVLEEDGYYFSTPEDLAKIIKNYSKKKYDSLINSNFNKISDYYNFNNIHGLYENLFIECLREK